VHIRGVKKEGVLGGLLIPRKLNYFASSELTEYYTKVHFKVLGLHAPEGKQRRRVKLPFLDLIVGYSYMEECLPKSICTITRLVCVSCCYGRCIKYTAPQGGLDLVGWSPSIGATAGSALCHCN